MSISKIRANIENLKDKINVHRKKGNIGQFEA